MNTLEGQQEWRKRPRKLQKHDSCDEDERGSHSEKNARCGHPWERKQKEAKSKVGRCMQERHDRGGSDRGQDNN